MNFNTLCEKYAVSSYEQLNKGWSSDKKFILTAGEKTYLLRISEANFYQKKQQQFELLKKIQNLNINCSKPIEFGSFSDGSVYTLLTWLPGVSAEEYLKTASDKEAYDLGVEAGKILKKLHGVRVDKQEKSWWQKYCQKIPKKIAEFNKLDMQLPCKQIVVDHILKNMHLVKGKRQCFSHADYHAGNLIVDGGKIGVIDFDKNTVSHTIDDFKKFCWNVYASEYFESGLINGYFNNNIPKDFFKILSLYAAESIVSHIPWAMRFGEQEVKVGVKVYLDTLKWFDNFNSEIPSWYKKGL